MVAGHRRLRTELRILEALEVNARVEAAHAHGADSIIALFDDIGRQVAAAQDHLEGFDRLPALSAAPAQATHEASRHADDVTRLIAALTA